MIIIKFSTDGLVYSDPGKNQDEVYVHLKYDNGNNVYLKEKLNDKKINYFNSTFMRRVGFISFYENNEVFNIPKHEQIEIQKKQE